MTQLFSFIFLLLGLSCNVTSYATTAPVAAGKALENNLNSTSITSNSNSNGNASSESSAPAAAVSSSVVSITLNYTQKHDDSSSTFIITTAITYTNTNTASSIAAAASTARPPPPFAKPISGAPSSPSPIGVITSGGSNALGLDIPTTQSLSITTTTTTIIVNTATITSPPQVPVTIKTPGSTTMTAVDLPPPPPSAVTGFPGGGSSIPPGATDPAAAGSNVGQQITSRPAIAPPLPTTTTDEPEKNVINTSASASLPTIAAIGSGTTSAEFVQPSNVANNNNPSPNSNAGNQANPSPIANNPPSPSSSVIIGGSPPPSATLSSSPPLPSSLPPPISNDNGNNNNTPTTSKGGNASGGLESSSSSGSGSGTGNNNITYIMVIGAGGGLVLMGVVGMSIYSKTVGRLSTPSHREVRPTGFDDAFGRGGDGNGFAMFKDVDEVDENISTTSSGGGRKNPPMLERITTAFDLIPRTSGLMTGNSATSNSSLLRDSVWSSLGGGGGRGSDVSSFFGSPKPITEQIYIPHSAASSVSSPSSLRALVRRPDSEELFWSDDYMETMTTGFSSLRPHHNPSTMGGASTASLSMMSALAEGGEDEEGGEGKGEAVKPALTHYASIKTLLSGLPDPDSSTRHSF